MKSEEGQALRAPNPEQHACRGQHSFGKKEFLKPAAESRCVGSISSLGFVGDQKYEVAVVRVKAAHLKVNPDLVG